MRKDDFERMYAEHARPLFAYLVYRTGDRDLAEDLLADTFERVLGAKRPFDPRRASEKTWLYAIATNVLRDHLRRVAAAERSLQQAYAGASAAPRIDELEAAEERDALSRAIATLTAEEQEVVGLRYATDLTVSEIAKVTRERRSTVHGRLYRSLRKLKQELEASGG